MFFNIVVALAFYFHVEKIINMCIVHKEISECFSSKHIIVKQIYASGLTNGLLNNQLVG